MKKISLIILAVFALISFNCSKEDNQAASQNTNNNNNNPPTQKELLTGKTWKLTSITTANPPTAQPGETNLPNCYKDNIHTFSTDEVYKIDEGNEKCNPSGPQVLTGSWSFTNNETQIYITADRGMQLFDIVDLNETTLRVSIIEGTYKNTFTYKHP